MAPIASIGRVVIIAVVASCTIICNGSMCPFQRIIIVVNRESRRLPPRCSGMTSSTIGRNIEGRVVRVGRLGIIRIMAAVAGIGRIGIVSVVTTCTVVGNGSVCAGKRVNGVVVEGSRCPGSFYMATGTICRELGCRVVRIGGLVVIGVVATVTGIGRAVIVPVVAGRTICCDGSMCAIQRKVVVMDREGSGCPSRCCGMAGGTIGRNTKRSMVGIACLRIVGIMATIASIGGIGVIPVVAGITIIRNTGMRTRKRVKIIMIERGRRPGRFTVTRCTIGWELRRYVVRIGGLRIIVGMAAIAGIGRVGVVSVVAGIAIIGNAGMCAV